MAENCLRAGDAGIVRREMSAGKSEIQADFPALLWYNEVSLE